MMARRWQPLAARENVTSHHISFPPGADGSTYTVSGARDHYRMQTAAGGFMVQRAPNYPSMFSELPHFPATTYKCVRCQRCFAMVQRFILDSGRENWPGWLAALDEARMVVAEAMQTCPLPFSLPPPPPLLTLSPGPAHNLPASPQVQKRRQGAPTRRPGVPAATAHCRRPPGALAGLGGQRHAPLPLLPPAHARCPRPGR